MKKNNMFSGISIISIFAILLMLSSCSTSNINNQVAKTNSNLGALSITSSISQRAINKNINTNTTISYQKYFNYKNNEFSINFTSAIGSGKMSEKNGVLYYSVEGISGKRNMTQQEINNLTSDINMKIAIIIANSTQIVNNGSSEYTINAKYTGSQAYKIFGNLLKPLIDQAFPAKNNITSQQYSKYLKELNAKITINLNTKYITSIEITETLSSNENRTHTTIINTINSVYSNQNNFKDIKIS